MDEVIKLVTTGGIGGIDLGAIYILCRECRFYLKATPEKKDYVFLSTNKCAKRMQQDQEIWREVGKKYFYIIPPIVIISLLIVGAVFILSQ